MSRCKDPLEREFLRMTRKFGWTRSVLVHQNENQSYKKRVWDDLMAAGAPVDRALPNARSSQQRTDRPLRDDPSPVGLCQGHYHSLIGSLAKIDTIRTTLVLDRGFDPLSHNPRYALQR